MKKLNIPLAVIVVLASLGCQSDKHASRTAVPIPVVALPQVYYDFDESFRTYFKPSYEYVFDDGVRNYFGSDGIIALEQALREAHPGYLTRVDFEDSVK